MFLRLTENLMVFMDDLPTLPPFPVHFVKCLVVLRIWAFRFGLKVKQTDCAILFKNIFADMSNVEWAKKQ